MRTVSVLESLALFIASAAAANVVEIGINRIRPGQPGLANTLRRRASSPSTYIETLVNNVTGGGYYASVTVGTPPQPQVLVIDTGSSDIWVVASDADLCTSSRLQEEYGDSCSDTYDSSKSSTYKLVSSEGFDISYLDGTGSSGDYITDTFDIGGASIKALQMGSATQTVRGTGIMGISYSASVSTLDVYPNLIDQFQAQGLISTKAYSLYLNDFRSESGSILFGGVDADKFIGNLSTMPIVQTSSQNGTGGYTVLAVALNSMTASTGSDKNPVDFPSSQPLPAILDSGTTLSYLPSDIATSLFDAIGAYTDDLVTGYTFIDCNGPSDLSVTLQLGKGATIVLPASQIVLDVFAGMQSQIPSNVPFSNACLFGFQDIGSASSSSLSAVAAANIVAATSGGSFALLGDTFLRSTYAVYDLTNNEIALAQSNLNSTSSKVVELQASDSGIPTLTGVQSQQTTSTTSTTSTTGGSGGSSTSDSSDSGGTVTVTANPKSSAGAAGSLTVPSYGVLAAAGAACLASFLGGALVMV